MNIIALVPAKGQSRRLPGKNMKLFCGKPLLEWTLIQIKYSRYINNSYLVTDSKEIAELGERYNAHIVWQTQEQIDKAEAEGQMGGTHSVVLGMEAAIKNGEVTGIYTLLPTCPLRKPDDIDNCVDMMRKNDKYPVFSMVRLKDSHLYKLEGDVCKMWFLDKTGKTMRTNAAIQFWTPPQFIRYYVNGNGFHTPQDWIDNKDGIGDLQPIWHELWQEYDIDIQEEFELCEYWMENKILKGNGEGAYKDYHDKVMSEFGFEQTAAGYNKGVEATHLPFEYRNSFFNHLPLFLQSIKNEKVDRYELTEHYTDGTMNTVKLWKANNARDCLSHKLEKPEPALIIGSGVSLNTAGPHLKDWKGATFCSTSQATTLVHYGLNPSYIVAYDIHSKPEEISRIDTWEGRGASLITHPGVNPQLIDYWKGPKLTFRSMDTSNFFFMNVLPCGYQDIIPSQLYLFSCSLAAQISLAKAMGYSPLFLVGCNFAETRATFYYFEKGVWVEYPGISSSSDMASSGQKCITSANGIITDPMSIFYKRSLLCVWRIDHSQCLIAYPEQSIITEMPGVNFESVIAYKGQGFENHYLTDDEIDLRADTYLAHFNQFIVKFREGGVRVIESGADPNWEPMVRSYLTMLNAAGEKESKPNLIDIDANVERFKAVKEMGNVIS